ncbi:MAG TPA: pitrilysin family protein [Candidatus Paceibacterota bacterium]|nr:pitrilysin family protein [Candidatus Paceibacterota bacterium]
MNFKKIIFKNGLRLLLVRQPASLAASVLILVEAGSEYETKRVSGLSHFLEHMMFKGTANRPGVGQIAEELASLGAQSNAFTAQEYTGYWAKAEARKLPKILDIVSDLYLHPLFNREEIEKERGVVIEELNMRQDMPAVQVQDLFPSLLYGDQPAGMNVGGAKDVIRKLAREDFLAYRGLHYVPQKTVVVVAGNFDEKKVTLDVHRYFDGLVRKKSEVKSKTTERQTKPALTVHFKESDQSHLVLGVRAMDIFDKRRYALQVLADVLGGGMSSRLFKKVREELGAAYYVNAGADLYLDHGYLAVSAGVDHAKIEQVLAAVLAELRLLKDETVPEKELQKSKDHLVGNIILNLETSDELAGFYGEQEILTAKVSPPAELVERIQKVTAREIRAVANDIFRNDKLNFAVIGPYKKKDQFAKMLRL